jgi:hypothetical protein
MHAHPLADRRDAEPALKLMLACGVTGFRQMGGSRALLSDRGAGKLALPVDGPALLSMPGEVLLPFNTGNEAVALQSVRQQAQAGADFIKVAMVTPQVFSAAQAEAARLGLTTVGHLPVGIDVRAASDGRMRSIEHLGPGVGIVAACCDHQSAIEKAVADRPAPKFPTVPRLPFAERLMGMLMARVMARIVINPLLLAKFADAELIADAGQSFNDDKARALARVFDEEGVKMIAGSDVSGSGWEIPGFALHEEFDQLAAAGLTPLRILQMATINAAEFLCRTATSGTLEPGKNADVVLLSANPVENMAHLHDIGGVVRAGRYYSPKTLSAMITSVAETRSAV